MSEPEEPIEVHIHGRYGRGPMPVEFRDALIELLKAVAKEHKAGTLGKQEAAQHEDRSEG